MAKQTGRPLHPDLETMVGWPNTVSYVVSLRIKYDSFLELTEAPPEEWWDHPATIRQHIEKLYPHMKNKQNTTVEIDPSEIEE